MIFVIWGIDKHDNMIYGGRGDMITQVEKLLEECYFNCSVELADKAVASLQPPVRSAVGSSPAQLFVCFTHNCSEFVCY